MKFAKYTFYAAGVYGLIALLPQYFLEARQGGDYPPAITHPAYYYGFIGVAVAWQVAFLVIGSDPRRFRPLMPAAMIEKFSFVIAAAALVAADRIAPPLIAGAAIDCVLGILFAIAFFKTGKE